LARQFTVTLLVVTLERFKLSGALGVGTSGSGIRRVEMIGGSAPYHLNSPWGGLSGR